ncbi:dihydroorotase [Neorickettsia sennetsu]|uniref:Dihydroorotase n=1 Tax=Ehrlichia sennetsu (strain ATCC VR-367 / Miyayama) TaxID=222891 RepID=Q2GEP4_EHRS3|nr:dihydroorotase [Neorickettsia sennetsu]ABD45806.1 dihydroorotase, multifunctional complex type [Neorickettsia sennetsu str. Miyayama]
MKKWNLPTGSDRKVAFVDARIVDPESGLEILGDLVVHGRRIGDFGESLLSDVELKSFDEVVNCDGHILMPGIIDIHVHLRDPGQLQNEDIHSGTKSAAAGGVTTVVCQPNTDPPIDTVETLAYIRDKAKRVGFVNVLCYASITGRGGDLTDMFALHKAGAVGFTDDGLPVMNSLFMRQAFMNAALLKVPVAQHAEDLDLSNGGCINEGAISHKLNVPGISHLAESVMVARDVLLLEQLGAHYHVLHVSTKKTVEIVRAAKDKGMRVTCEVTPHHLLLTEEAVDGYNTAAKMNPPLRTEEDRLCMIEALKDGTIDAIASDHAPHNEVYKELPLKEAAFGVVGLETILPLSLELYHSGALELHSLLAKLTCNPAKIIGSEAGRIKVGAPADLVLLDLNSEVRIETRQFVSKSKNSPFGGRKTRGKVLRTIVGGDTVYMDV